jgi:hypothetical protein
MFLRSPARLSLTDRAGGSYYTLGTNRITPFLQGTLKRTGNVPGYLPAQRQFHYIYCSESVSKHFTISPFRAVQTALLIVKHRGRARKPAHSCEPPPRMRRIRHAGRSSCRPPCIPSLCATHRARLFCTGEMAPRLAYVIYCECVFQGAQRAPISRIRSDSAVERNEAQRISHPAAEGIEFVELPTGAFPCICRISASSTRREYG